MDTERNMSEVRDGNGAQVPERYNRQIIRAVTDGKVSVTLENTLREKYGKTFVDEYKNILKESKEIENSNDPNRRKRLINLSALVKQKENPTTPVGGGAVPEVPKQVEEEKKDKREDETDKEYYLRILQRRLELIEQKYGIKFDQELIDYFKSDEYYKNGNINFLENDETLKKIHKVWSETELLDTSSEVIDKVAEENKKAMEVIKNNAFKYGDSSLYSSVVEDCEELENYVEKTKKDALNDEKFYNEQKTKDRVERAILAMAVKSNENEEIKALGEVLTESINKRADYMKDEIDIKNYRRNLKIKEDSTKSLDEIKVVKDSDDKLVLLLNERRENRPNGFGPRVVETKEDVQEVDNKVPVTENKDSYYNVYHEKEENLNKNIEPAMDINSPMLDNFMSEEVNGPVKENENVKKLVLTFNKPNQSDVV